MIEKSYDPLSTYGREVLSDFTISGYTNRVDSNHAKHVGRGQSIIRRNRSQREGSTR